MGRGLQPRPEPDTFTFGVPSFEPHISVSRGLAWQYFLSWYLAGVTHLHWNCDDFDHAGCLHHHVPSHKTKALQCLLFYAPAYDNSRRRHLSAREYDVLLYSTWIGHVDTRLGHADI